MWTQKRPLQGVPSPRRQKSGNNDTSLCSDPTHLPCLVSLICLSSRCACLSVCLACADGTLVMSCCNRVSRESRGEVDCTYRSRCNRVVVILTGQVPLFATVACQYSHLQLFFFAFVVAHCYNTPHTHTQTPTRTHTHTSSYDIAELQWNDDHIENVEGKYGYK